MENGEGKKKPKSAWLGCSPNAAPGEHLPDTKKGAASHVNAPSWGKEKEKKMEKISGFAFDGSKFNNSGHTLWLGWSNGGWGNGPCRYEIKVGRDCPAIELISEGRSPREADVVRKFRPLTPSDLEGTDGMRFAAARAAEEFERGRQRRRVEDRLRKDGAFLTAVLRFEMERDAAIAAHIDTY